MKQRYQHVTPKEHNHTVTPSIKDATRCAVCGALVKPVDDDEGPESLKSLLKLR